MNKRNNQTHPETGLAGRREQNQGARPITIGDGLININTTDEIVFPFYMVGGCR